MFLIYGSKFLVCELELLISVDKIVLAPIMLREIVAGTKINSFYIKHIIRQTCAYNG